MSLSIIERLILYSDLDPETGCWEWKKAKHPTGYGVLWTGDGYTRAHRLSYEHFRGSLEKFDCLHTCDNKACINPDHLYAGTSLDNVRDKMKRNPNWHNGIITPLFYSGEVELIRRLGAKKKPNGYRQFSAAFVCKMFKCSASTIRNIWWSKQWLCKGGVYA